RPGMPRLRPRTPLTAAIDGAQPNAVAALLKLGVALTRNDQGDAALCLAIRNAGQFSRRPIDNIRNKARTNDEVLNDQWRIIQLLVSHGVDVRSLKSHALCQAVERSQSGIVEYLLRQWASVDGCAEANSPGDPQPTVLTA